MHKRTPQRTAGPLCGRVEHGGEQWLLCQTIQKSQLFDSKKGVFRFILGLFKREKTPNLSHMSRVLTVKQMAV
jgi:hypothetical protein